MYQLDQPAKPTSLIPWIYVFNCVGLDVFRHVYQITSFTLYPTGELSKIGRDASLSYLKLLDSDDDASAMKKIFPLAPSQEEALVLFKLTKNDDTYSEKKIRLFEYAFELFAEIGAAEAVYNWGINTQKYFKYKDREVHRSFQTLKNWFRFLRTWALQEIEKSQIDTKYITGFEELEKYNLNIYIDSSALNLPISKYVSLQKVILDTESQILLLTKRMTREWQSKSHDPWEIYAYNRVLGKGNFIQEEGKMRTYLQAWTQIKNILNDSELSQFRNWVRAHDGEVYGLHVLGRLPG